MNMRKLGRLIGGILIMLGGVYWMLQGYIEGVGFTTTEWAMGATALWVFLIFIALLGMYHGEVLETRKEKRMQAGNLK